MPMEIRVDKAKCIEDYIAMCECLNNLSDLIPDWQHMEAQPLFDKISGIISKWITVESKRTLK